MWSYKIAHPLPANSVRPNPIQSSEPNTTLESLGVISKWEPPELPTNIFVVSVTLGGITLSRPAASVPNDPTVSSNFMNMLEFHNGFTPAQSPIEPYVKNNRFYVAVKNLLITNLDTVFMNEDLNYPLPPRWDRNYNSNTFEIVAEDGLPVLQVIYLNPTWIQVNGIFFFSKTNGLIAFGNGFETRNFPLGPADDLFSKRKTLFKYPSNLHLHELASAPPSPTNATEPPKPTIEQEVSYFSKMAAARQWQPPELPPQLPDISGGGKMIEIKIGGNYIALPVGAEGWHFIHPYSGPAGEDFTPYIISNRLYIKIKTMFGDAEQTVEMNNEWPPKIPDGWDRNFNANSFEIVDEKMLPVFQVRYNSPNAIEINGIFVAPDGAITIAFGHYMIQQRAGLPVPKIPERKAWFKYPSKDNLGELADQ